MKPRKRQFTLQWHITAKCDQHCKHCYMYDSDTYTSELQNPLSYEDCLKIIDDFSELLKRWGVEGRINFTGGDPLLRNDFYDLLGYTNEKSIHIGILGNPYHLTHKTASKLKELGVMRYQVSIDGMEKTHDQFRRMGSFNETIKALGVLRDVGIPSVVMFTLSKKNVNDLFDVIDLVNRERVSFFDFARLVPIGTGKQLKDEQFTPQEYRKLLLKILEKYREMEKNNCFTHYGRKENLWMLLYQELGLLKPLPEQDNMIYDGCSIGFLLSILANGIVYACRRLPVQVGKVPEQKLKNIILKSKELNKMYKIENMIKCSNCDLARFCRGCPAVSYAANGDYCAPDPQCWKSC